MRERLERIFVVMLLTFFRVLDTVVALVVGINALAKSALVVDSGYHSIALGQKSGHCIS